MSYYIGIDLGTSAVKMLMTDEKGNIIKSVSKKYPLYFPQEGWSEQNPADWWTAVKEGLKELTADSDKSLVKGISFGGQMHGLVILDENDNVIRPAILWNDGRTQDECDYLNNEIGKNKLSEYTANIAFAGFTAPKLLWIKKNEPDNFKRINKIMLPKDYIAYMLTGVHSTDYSDASGMLLLDVKSKEWSQEMLSICGIDESVMPKLYESYEVTGTLKPEIATELGLNGDTKVIAGAFVGMSMDTTQADMTQAVLEGVAFGLRDSVEVARSLGMEITRSTICGGGARSELWCNIVANVMNMEIVTLKKEEGPAMGGAMLAMVGCGEYDDMCEAADKIVKTDKIYTPNPELVKKYKRKYRKFTEIYPQIRSLFH